MLHHQSDSPDAERYVPEAFVVESGEKNNPGFR
jgi:hypothetical protein